MGCLVYGDIFLTYFNDNPAKWQVVYDLRAARIQDTLKEVGGKAG